MKKAHFLNEDKREILEAEIGDLKQENFFPQVKIKRFDNEVNFSMRYDQKTHGLGTVEQIGEKTIWKNGKEEVHIYEVDNGYELEAILKEKPVTNRVDFTIQTKGLSFYFQPELTEAEIKAGHRRPEHVVNSYAVYMTDKKKNIQGGKVYRSGKVGHIYRPKIIDSKGEWVWGHLILDEISNILSVEIPQEFLDTANYPVKVDPTFGYDTAGGSSAVAGSAAGAIGSLFNTLIAIPGDVVTGISFYAREAAGSETVTTGIYTVSGGELDVRTGATGTVNVNSGTPQWWSTSHSIALTDGVEYGVAYGSWGGGVGSENTRIYYDTGAPSGTGSLATTTSLPATWSEAGNFSFYFSIYATYTREPVDIDYTFTVFIDKANP